MDAAEVTRRVEEHTAAVGRADAEALRSLYASDARLFDPVGDAPVVGRDAIGAHFARWLTAPRAITNTRVVVCGRENSLASVAFTATPDAGDPVDIVDVLRFGPDLLIVQFCAFAAPGAGR